MLIKNAKVFDYSSNIDGKMFDVRVKDGIITEIGEGLESGGERIIRANKLQLMPGIIDLHAHLREPGGEHKETIETGAKSAAKGGITTILAMPNTTPPMDNPEILDKMRAVALEKSPVDILFSSTMTKERRGLDVVNFKENKFAGYAAFTDDGSGIHNERLMQELSEAAKENDVLLMEHPENPFLSENAPCSYGKLEDLLHIKGQSAESESLNILKFGTIAGMVGARIHFTHISTFKSVEAIRMLKRLYPGLITADATPHHISLSEDDNLIPDTNKKMNPPLRPESDRLAIERGLLFGTIDAIATDHAPHSEKEKAVSFVKAPCGTIGFETMFPVIFTHCVQQRRISMLDMVKLVSANPAKILGLTDRGSIAVGKRADLILVDPSKRWKVKPEDFISKSKNSAFIGQKLFGEIRLTISNGKVVYER